MKPTEQKSPTLSRRRWAPAWRLLVYIAAIPVTLYVLYWILVYLLAFSHQPPPAVLPLTNSGDCSPQKWPHQLSIMTWNLGYAGTGAEADFFMDKGHDVLAKDQSTVLRHLHNIIDVLNAHSENIYLLQEVDSGSRRTYYTDQLDLIRNGLSHYCSSYALNHNVFFMPYPYTQPLGRIRSGLLSLAAYRPAQATRLQLPGSFPFPDSAFTLERCLLVWKLPREDGRDWVVINSHLEAWDRGNIRSRELAFLKEFALKAYSEGSYVIIGGDWNSVLPGVSLNQFPSVDEPNVYTMPLPDDLFPKDWNWGIARSHPSSRRTNAPYQPGKSFVTIIDGFVVSPNVQIRSVETVALGFKDSDHEPIVIQLAGE